MSKYEVINKTANILLTVGGISLVIIILLLPPSLNDLNWLITATLLTLPLVAVAGLVKIGLRYLTSEEFKLFDVWNDR